MRYMLLIYANEAGMAAAPAEGTYEVARLCRLHRSVEEVRRLVAGDRLKPTQSATSVRIADGKTNVLDGPYADTKEQLAGFYMIEAEDADAAIAWAARCPAASTGTVEVRPIWEQTM